MKLIAAAVLMLATPAYAAEPWMVCDEGKSDSCIALPTLGQLIAKGYDIKGTFSFDGKSPSMILVQRETKAYVCTLSSKQSTAENAPPIGIF